MLEIKNLDGNIGGFHLRNSNLTVADGEYLVILGPTGAGKTVLIEYIVGIHQPDNGQILVDGEDISHLYTEERNIAYVPQDYALFPNLNVEKNIAYGLEARRLPKKEINRTVSDIIGKLGLDYIRHRMPLHLSGGEKQRVALGRALVTRPRLVLLDEPLSALDENLRADMARQLRKLQKSVNGSFIHVSHNFEESSEVADRIAIMDHGEIVQAGTLNALKTGPKNEFVARFLKSHNMFDARSEGNALRAGHLALAIDGTCPEGEVTAVIRPENIDIVEDGADDAVNCFTGKVEEIVSRPHFLEIRVNAGRAITVFTTRDCSFAEGDAIKIRIPPEKIVVIPKS